MGASCRDKLYRVSVVDSYALHIDHSQPPFRPPVAARPDPTTGWTHSEISL